MLWNSKEISEGCWHSRSWRLLYSNWFLLLLQLFSGFFNKKTWTVFFLEFFEYTRPPSHHFSLLRLVSVVSFCSEDQKEEKVCCSSQDSRRSLLPALIANKREAYTPAHRNRNTYEHSPTMIYKAKFMLHCVKGTFHSSQRPLTSIFYIAIEIPDKLVGQFVCTLFKRNKLFSQNVTLWEISMKIIGDWEVWNIFLKWE